MRIRSITSGVVHHVAEHLGGRYVTACGLKGKKYPMGFYVALVGEPDRETGESHDVTCKHCLREMARGGGGQ